jgi:hypothetical protein
VITPPTLKNEVGILKRPLSWKIGHLRSGEIALMNREIQFGESRTLAERSPFMEQDYFECPELSGKTIQTLRIYKDTGDGQTEPSPLLKFRSSGFRAFTAIHTVVRLWDPLLSLGARECKMPKAPRL